MSSGGNISKRILCLLKDRGISKAEFSRMTGISRNTITDWEKKGSNPSADRIACISEQLQVSTDFILTGKEASLKPSYASIKQEHNFTQDDVDLLLAYKKLDMWERAKILTVIMEKLNGSNDEIGATLDPEMVSAEKNLRTAYEEQYTELGRGVPILEYAMDIGVSALSPDGIPIEAEAGAIKE